MLNIIIKKWNVKTHRQGWWQRECLCATSWCVSFLKCSSRLWARLVWCLGSAGSWTEMEPGIQTLMALSSEYLEGRKAPHTLSESNIQHSYYTYDTRKLKHVCSPDWDGDCGGGRSNGAPGGLLTIWANFCTCWVVFCRAADASFTCQNK